MFWWFKRGDNYVRYEARQNDVASYELRIVNVDGTEAVEIFDNDEDLSARQRDLERQLVEEGFSGPHGWNL
jgi:hypothetical protein